MPNLEEIDANIAAFEHRFREQIRATVERENAAPHVSPLSIQRRRTSMLERARAELPADAPALRRCRLERGLTQREAAILCGIGVRTYKRAEAHPEDSAEITLHRIARAFRLPFEAVRNG